MLIESVEDFARLCESSDPAVCRLAALGEATEAVWMDVLERYPSLKEEVIFNKKVPISVLGILAQDANREIRRLVGGKRKLSRRLLEQLANDPDPGVRESVAGNGKFPEDLLVDLCKDRNRYVREAAKLLAERAAKTAKKGRQNSGR